MKRTLRTSKPMPNMEEMKKAAEQIDPNMLGNVQNVVDKYANKSEAELMQELTALEGLRSNPEPSPSVRSAEDLCYAVILSRLVP